MMLESGVKYAALCLCLLAAVWAAPADAGVKKGTDVMETAGETVIIGSETQKVVETWLAEERELMARIDSVKARLKQTAWQQEKTLVYRETLEAKLASLKERAAEMETVELELLPVLDQSIRHLRTFVETDLPAGRKDRLKKIMQAEQVLDDYDMSLLAKARAVFEAVSQEVDLGYTVDVQEDEIVVDAVPRRVKLLRVGRVGLYALTMDSGKAYVWDTGAGSFVDAGNSIRDIREAMEMVEGQRMIGLSRLPLDRPIDRPLAAGPDGGGRVEGN